MGDEVIVNMNGVTITQGQLVSLTESVPSCDFIDAFIHCMRVDDTKLKRRDRILFPAVLSSIFVEKKDEVIKMCEAVALNPFPMKTAIFLPILRNDKWIIFRVNKTTEVTEKMTQMLSCNVDGLICEEVWTTKIKETFQQNMNSVIKKGKLELHKPKPVLAQGPSTNDMAPVMSFLETDNISFMDSVMKTKTSCTDYMMPVLEYIVFHLENGASAVPELKEV